MQRGARQWRRRQGRRRRRTCARARAEALSHWGDAGVGGMRGHVGRARGRGGEPNCWRPTWLSQKGNRLCALSLLRWVAELCILFSNHSLFLVVVVHNVDVKWHQYIGQQFCCGHFSRSSLSPSPKRSQSTRSRTFLIFRHACSSSMTLRYVQQVQS